MMLLVPMVLYQPDWRLSLILDALARRMGR